MGARAIAREPRLAAAISGLALSRRRSSEIQSSLIERHPKDHRIKRYDSTAPVAVIASVAAISAGMGVSGATKAASGSGGGGGGYYGGGGGSSGGSGLGSGGGPF